MPALLHSAQEAVSPQAPMGIVYCLVLNEGSQGEGIPANLGHFFSFLLP